ncbi:MAG: hypothetical protein FD124_2479 [Alphaproteobacteria bacterium]|nr:MAG: hypothetical protein FD124_2479 [Alphaproteobacteria bacterium]
MSGLSVFSTNKLNFLDSVALSDTLGSNACNSISLSVIAQHPVYCFGGIPNIQSRVTVNAVERSRFNATKALHEVLRFADRGEIFVTAP